MKNAVLHALIVTLVLVGLVDPVAADYKSTLQEHWLRILSLEENLDFGYIHPTVDAAGAVDGNRHENWAFYTEKRNREAWWEVDLEKDTLVGRIDVYNARNGVQRAHIVQIMFSRDHDTWETVYDNKGKVKFLGGKKGEKPLSVRFDGKKTRWVRLRIPKYDYFHLSEVEVYAKGDDAKNVALDKYATQSSTSGRSTVSYKGPLVNGARPRPPLPPGCKSLATDPKLKYGKYVTAEVIQKALEVAGKTAVYVAKSGVNLSSQKTRLDAMKQRWEAKKVPQDKRAEFYVALRHLRRDMILRHPDLKIDRLLINRVPPTAYSHNGDQHVGRHSRLGPGLTILDNWKTDIKVRALLADGKLPIGSVRNPELHFDAGKVAFGFCDHTRKGHKRFFIYEAALDGSWVRQITGTPKDPLKTSGNRATVLIEDNDPCYLPDGDIMFVSTRCQSYGRCHGGRYNPAWTLYRMKADGSGIRQVSFNNENEYEPAVLNDGRIVFTRWEYTFRHEMFFHMLWWCRPDGTEVSNFYGADTLHPMMVVEATPIPGSHKIVATAQGHHSYNTGTTIVINPRLGENGEKPVTRITTETPYSESPGSGWPKPHWSHPYPVNEELFFVSRANHRVYKQGMLPPLNNRAIYLVDSFGGREFIYEDPKIASFSPIPIRKRKRPPVLPSRAMPGQEHGTLFVQNVYLTRNDPDGVIKPGMIKAIRLNA
ncbi:MAG: discoidin domain-containing protein, partial [Phycisphaerae bacterium]|nr:discoidin domain-containing protein [Phycisphaerae bacterium]